MPTWTSEITDRESYALTSHAWGGVKEDLQVSMSVVLKVPPTSFVDILYNITFIIKGNHISSVFYFEGVGVGVQVILILLC